MRTTIDASGRVVVPKPLRDELGLRGGTSLEIRANAGRIEIEPLPTPMRLARRGKGLVAVSDIPLPTLGAEEVRSVVDSQRR
jgi:AbrB family looped-hinge helix DNA binding protein